MKKFLSMILALCMLLSVGVVAYADHEHQLMDMANMNCHYSECTICFELFNVGDHTFKDGECTVCGHSELINPFLDVEEEAWYHDDVLSAVGLGLVNGKSATEFKPDDNLTYAEAVKLAACMNQSYTEGEVTLKNGDPWYQTYVDYCKEKKIIFSDYQWDEKATRIGYMYIFACALPDEAYEVINDVPDGSIPDVPQTAPYAAVVYKLYRAGIVTGVDEAHNCNPTANIKRSEVATIVARMMDPSKRKKFDLSSDESLENKGTIDDSGEKNETETIVTPIAPTDPPIIDTPDVEINGNQSIVVGPSEQPDIDPGESPILPTPTEEPGIVIIPSEKVEIGEPGIVIVPSEKVEVDEPPIISFLTIYKQPKGYEAEKYGEKYELEVQVYGGKAPYTYQWYYYTGYRNQKSEIANGDYVKDVTSEALILSIEKENTLLGKGLFCKITDSEGTTVTTDTVYVYGPFSMVVEDCLLGDGNYILTGRIADGVIRPGDKISVERDGKIIAIGTVEELQMFGKALDEGTKGDNVGIVFNRTEGVRPTSGDLVIKYQDSHVLDTSDIVN